MIRKPTYALLVASLFAAGSFAQPSNYELVAAFRAGGAPAGSLLQGSDGYFYGTTDFGGTSGVGTVYRMDASGNTITLHNFAYGDGAVPLASLIQGTDGFFYGTTSQGGAHNLGVVFRMDASGNVTRLHSFEGADGAKPAAALLQASDGDFYGTTDSGGAGGHGSVFRMDSAGNVTTIHSFDGTDGENPRAPLVEAYGQFYGTSRITAFTIDASGSFTVLHNFVGCFNCAPSAIIHASDGNFWGTTAYEIFRFDLSGNYTTVINVGAGTPLLQAADGYLYGSAPDVFRMDYGGNLTDLGLGRGSHHALIQAIDGTFYGLRTWIPSGFNYNRGPGDVFKFDLAGNVSSIHVFGNAGPANPVAPLIQATDMNFYGTTYLGGIIDPWCDLSCGTLFRLEPSSGRLTTLHAMGGGSPFGTKPSTGLIQATDGMFYGTTSDGSALGPGSAYRISNSSKFELLHNFQCDTEGCSPSALIQATDGNFYGTTLIGGYGRGTVFRMGPSGNVIPIYRFQADEGHNPMAPLIQGADGAFYGTNNHGPGITGQYGTVFRVDSTGSLTTLHDFNQGGGAYPKTALLQTADGALYGTTAGNNGNPPQTIFKIDADGVFSELNTIGGSALVQGNDGEFYSTNPYTIFKIDPAGNYTELHTLHDLDGGGWPSSLILASDGNFYGTTPGGGPGYGGGVFRLTTSAMGANSVLPTAGLAVVGTYVGVLGGGFVDGATMTVGGVAATDVTVLDPTFLYAAIPGLEPGNLYEVVVTNPGARPNSSATLSNGYFTDFLDVPQGDIFHDYVESLVRSSVTAGCGGGNYCRDGAALRRQMAVFVLKAKEGPAYVPPPAVGIFTDVPASDPFAPWIEELYHRGVVAGCGAGPTYCPDNSVLRQQMAVFLLKTLLGSSYVPPPCTGIFPDVPCSNPFALWIEDFFNRGIAAGCGNGDYCPYNPTTRGQMAVFLVKTFGL